MSTEFAPHPTTWHASPELSARLGARVAIASELGQRTGSFKYRAAHHVAASVPQQHLITASSGNFGQALALACQRLGKTCAVVMPLTSAAVKVRAVRDHAAEVHLIDVSRVSRAARVAELAAERPDAYVASAYDDPLVIGGNATLGAEIAREGTAWDAVIAPVGGGGLTAGILTGLREAGSEAPLWGAEPLLANDAARSLRAGARLANDREPMTLADGARTVSLGAHNWEVLKDGLAGIVEVPEEAIALGLRLLAEAGLRVEPTGALAVAALLTEPERWRGRTVCCVVSGGNVDAALYDQLLAD